MNELDKLWRVFKKTPTRDPLAAVQLAADPSATNVFLVAKAGTPVNAAYAAKLLTIGTLPAEGATVSMGGVAYKFRAALGAGAKANSTLTLNVEVPHDGDTVIIGGSTYTLKTALTPTANQILIEATNTATISNIIACLGGGAGSGTKFAADSDQQTSLVITNPTPDTMLVTAPEVGFLWNAAATAGTMTHGTWNHTTLTGGVDAQAANDVLRGVNVEASIDNLVLAVTLGTGIGTKFGTGTVVNPLVTAVKASASTMTCTNKIIGVVGNDTVIGETLADGSWAAAAVKLGGGVDGTIGKAGQVMFDATKLYFCTLYNGAAGANWKAATWDT